tara:strand:- start:712 stop:948 length:237 start_codon:yes stop_codon:yes gene_type:complete
MGSVIWNGKQQEIKGTILEDLINGFWKVSEDIYYDNLASKMDDMRYVDETPDDDAWYYNDQGSDSDQVTLGNFAPDYS